MRGMIPKKKKNLSKEIWKLGFCYQKKQFPVAFGVFGRKKRKVLAQWSSRSSSSSSNVLSFSVCCWRIKSSGEQKQQPCFELLLLEDHPKQ